ncbi:AmpD protein [Nitrosomonas marina]|uniref:1,6-anhydro-N-acetylmuramyl-L-alanine amidase AmpD n=1 Tax=Nitrosomonas marina TaxID=917 RepID=A0A1H9Y764_9PROT|nr:1,6-anhydro-N-acetylmuramyl-L-alanine amidase AmpD [Nitrosomonas marina]SES64779.1 AmpD protein [Nitrosomonas marina]
MKIDTDGCLQQADRCRFIASPNYDERPDDADITLLVIHGISLPPGEFGGEGVIELFTNRIDPEMHPYYVSIAGLKVSCHFFIRRNGEMIQFVRCRHRAWHAGLSSWRGRSCCNDFSIGIELEGSDTTPFTETQYSTLTALTRCLQQHYPITDIAGHADIAPGRKTDPGPYFDWIRYQASLEKPQWNQT